MPEMPKAAPLPDRPPLHLKGGYLAIASPDSIAEASFSVPAVRAIRDIRPMSSIVVVANQATAPLWRALPEINLVIEHAASDSARKIARLLKESNVPFDSAIAWEGGPAAQAFVKFGIKDRLGFPSAQLAKHLTDPVIVERKIGPIEHRVQHYLLFVQKLGAQPFRPANFTPPPRPDATGTPTIVIVPGSDFGPAAAWPLERLIELSKKLAEHHELTLLPCPDQPKAAAALAKALGQSVATVEGDELIHLLATSRGMIASDGSLPHLAALVGTPAMVFFGPNEPAWQRPLGKIHKVIRRHVPCSGCLLNKCPLDHRCMTEITVDEAYASALTLFAGA